jgi:hypothetical protein
VWRRPLSALTVAALLLTALVLTSGLVACSAPEQESAVTYHLRGQVTALPDPADPLSDLRIRHEPVDDFVSMDGEVVGMDSMNMPFPVGGGVDVSDLQVGDKVAFTMVVDWDADVPYQVTEIEVLPPDTELVFGKVKSGGEAEDGDGAADAGAMDMDEGAMDPDAMDHGTMDHDGTDHGAMDHDAMDDGTPSATTSDEPGDEG